MQYRLKLGTAKKLREQYYLMMLFWGVIWVLMAILFSIDDNPQTLLIYLGASILLVPYLVLKKVKPYFDNLSANVENAYLEFAGNEITFNHFENLKKFDREEIKFNVADIVHVKKAFRKDEAVNKITLTLKDKTKIKIEDFDDMDDLTEAIFTKSEAISNQTQG